MAFNRFTRTHLFQWGLSAFLVAFLICVSGGGLNLAWGATAEQGGTTTVAKKLPICEPGVKNPDGSSRSYQDFALCMAAEIDKAIESYNSGNYDQAIDDIGVAYFAWYENALEPASMTLPGNRKIKMEGRFTRAKLAIKTNPSDSSIPDKLEEIKVAVAHDAMVLDGVLDAKAPESAGKQLLTTEKAAKADTAHWNVTDFTTSLGLLLREGLEAMLVVVAIVLYLIKSGNRHLVKGVYAGVGAAVLLSVLLAWIMQRLVGGTGRASELIEGFTMFLAVGMLFYVSNWMLSKTSAQNWQNYIKGMVETSVSTGAARALVFAAFLAVMREGAELVLFYTAAFGGGAHSAKWAALGLVAGVAILAVIFVVIRYGGVRLPVRPIFMATSILLFLMCISFVGKGVGELKEAGFIYGETDLPWMHYEIPDLGIFAQAETLLPQLIILIASVWVFLSHTVGAKKKQDKQTQDHN